MRKYYFALDLVDDSERIAEYEAIHKRIWPEIENSMFEAGITQMEIFRAGDRMFMIMEVNEEFSFENKAKSDQENPVVRKWEEYMWTFQKALPFAQQGEKWVRMNKIFDLKESTGL
jgi:L-rhamnose mutarotase